MSDWTPPAAAKVVIVCAACRYGDFIAAGPRHFDETMQRQVEAFIKAEGLHPHIHADFDQGFIDQFGRYYTRQEAMDVVRKNGQPFNLEENGGNAAILYSEGLY